jgi:hypothetical protein
MLALLLTLLGLYILFCIGWAVVCAFLESPEVRHAFLAVVGVGVYCFLPVLLPEPWGLWTFFGLAACGLMAAIVAAGLEYFRAPRSVSVGRGRWRLIAWGQLRLSPGAATGLAAALAVALVAGSVLGARAWLEAAGRDPRLAEITVVALIGLCVLIVVGGIVISVVGMRRAWREGERHRWPERWSEMPPDDVTGLVPRPPAGVPASSPARPHGPPSPSVAGHGGRPQ